MSKWYQIVAQKDSPKAEIYLYGLIGQWEKVNASEFVAELKRLEKEYSQIDIHINSDGGVITEGTAIYNAMKNSTATIHTYNDGIAASMGAILLLAGEKVHMASNATLMLHKPSAGAMGEADDMRQTADLLDKMENNLVNMISAKTGKESDWIKNNWVKAREDKWFNADEAMQAGLIDAVTGSVAKDIPKPTNIKQMNTAEVAQLYSQRLVAQLNKNTNQNSMDVQSLLNALEIKNVEASNGTAAFATVTNKFNALNAKVNQLQNENETLRNAQKESEKSQKSNLINAAKDAGKITAKQVPAYEKIAENNSVEELKALFDTMEAPKNFNDLITKGKGASRSDDKRADWSFTKWTKEDPKGLASMKEKDFEGFKALFEDEFKVAYEE